MRKAQTLAEAGRMDGRFDGNEGVWEPRLADTPLYLDAYQAAHREATAVRNRTNARLNFAAGYGAAQAGEDYETALTRLGLATRRQVVDKPGNLIEVPQPDPWNALA